jgi:hypothetical protein
MASVEIVAFETQVDKYCADWVLEVAKLLKQAREGVSARTNTLGKKIAGLGVPAKATPKEISEIPARINQIVKENSVRLKEIVEMELYMALDAKAKKLTHSGQSFKGHITAL